LSIRTYSKDLVKFVSVILDDKSFSIHLFCGCDDGNDDDYYNCGYKMCCVMHPSISTFLRLGCGGNWSMWNILLLLLGDSKARMVIQFHKLSVMGLSYCLLSVGHAQETSKARLSRVIPIRCHLSLLLSM